MAVFFNQSRCVSILPSGLQKTGGLFFVPLSFSPETTSKMSRIFSIALFTLLGPGMLSAQTPSPTALDSLYLKNAAYARLTSFWDIYPAQKADVVMLGNSITQGVAWNELLQRPMILNRGISGDYLVGFLHRMKYITRLPAIPFGARCLSRFWSNTAVRVPEHCAKYHSDCFRPNSSLM